MAENSNISWTHHTFNPVIGCTKVSAACDFCYAEDHANKWEPLVTWGKPGQKSKLRRTVESNWRKPLSWNKQAGKMGIRYRVFCASMADVFDNDWDNDTRADLWALIASTPHLDWLLLTKRPQNIRKMLPGAYVEQLLGCDKPWGDGWSNVWLGMTAENQDEYWRRRQSLFDVPAAVHFISYEPALGALSIQGPMIPDWVICGGESGPNRRPFDLKWATDLKDECEKYGIPFYFKQDSSHKPGCKGRASDELWACKQFPTSPLPAQPHPKSPTEPRFL